MELNSLREIIEVENGENPVSKSKLQTTVLVEMLKSQLKQVEQECVNNQSQKTRVRDIRKVIGYIGEIEVKEVQMLQKIIEIYDPYNYNY